MSQTFIPKIRRSEKVEVSQKQTMKRVTEIFKSN